MYDLIVPASELQNLPDYTACGRPQEPFVLQSAPPLWGVVNPNIAETVLRTSQERYGRDRGQVERRLKRFLSPRSLQIGRVAKKTSH